MDKEPFVSVIIPAHNSILYTERCITSVLASSYGPYEVIVVDDASTDASCEIVRSFVDPRIRLIKHARNTGASISRNDAIRIARGEYVAIMDADDLSYSHRLETQVRFLDSQPDIGLVGSGVYDNIDVDGSILYSSHLPEDSETIQKTILEKWCFLHPSIMFRKNVVEKSGYYREEFDVAEDHDFILRVLDHHKAQNIRDKLVAYRINPKGLSVARQIYINELGTVAMRLGKERREGRTENMEREISHIKDLQNRINASTMLSRAWLTWQNSFYASDRYYGFGCKNLYVGNLKLARRCFSRSIHNNYLFMKSWICFCLALLPFAVIKKYRFIFRSSKQYYDEYKNDQSE
jgi:glycosyltransferase involved in cell wall biosynthesis